MCSKYIIFGRVGFNFLMGSVSVLFILLNFQPNTNEKYNTKLFPFTPSNSSSIFFHHNIFQLLFFPFTFFLHKSKTKHPHVSTYGEFAFCIVSCWFWLFALLLYSHCHHYQHYCCYYYCYCCCCCDYYYCLSNNGRW